LQTYFVKQIGMSGLEFAGLTLFFWDKTSAAYQAEHANENAEAGAAGAGTREAMKSKVTWLCALFFFAYMGVEGKRILCILPYYTLHIDTDTRG
jgi:hypothetical protein